MRKMGGMASLLDRLPPQFAQAAQSPQMDEKHLRRVEGIINSMTPAERTHPEIIKASRKRRIAAAAGVSGPAVNRKLALFEPLETMMKQMKGGHLQRLIQRLQ